MSAEESKSGTNVFSCYTTVIDIMLKYVSSFSWVYGGALSALQRFILQCLVELAHVTIFAHCSQCMKKTAIFLYIHHSRQFTQVNGK